MRELRPFLKGFSRSTALALTLKMPSCFLTSHWIYSSFALAQHGQGAFPGYYPCSWLSALASKPLPLPSFAQAAPPTPGPHPVRRDHKPRSGDPRVLPTGPRGCHAHPPEAQPLAPASPEPPWPSPGLHHYFFPQTALEASDWGACETARLLRRTVTTWPQACPKGWRLSTCCSAGLSPASSLLWPTPGAYLRSGAYSQSLLPNQNEFMQLQLKGLQTICFLVSFPWWEAFPMGTRITTHLCDIKLKSCVAVFPARFCWNAAVCHLKVFLNIKSQRLFG